LEANERFTGKSRQMPLPAKNSYTVKEFLTKFLDLTGPLAKKAVKEIAESCADS